ncbi:hypothetical protein V496_03822 [Pseudogymnoascus sp. VKM F-4515 (FW-2607)]|nr:hypothetical protein V496_03822 [Pseudogymnoascus sp. VKM F-4515 (FW-2607)]
MATTVDQKLLKATKFPPEFNQKVDMQKVNLEVMRKWIAGKISDILGSEDDVVIELCFNLIEGSRYPEIKKLQIQLTGFLEKDTPAFCKELWKLCLSAQNSPQGVPKELLEAKKLELIQEKVEAEKAAEEARRRREIDNQRERDMDSIRNPTIGAAGVEIAILGVVETTIEGAIEGLAHLGNGVPRRETQTHTFHEEAVGGGTITGEGRHHRHWINDPYLCHLRAPLPADVGIQQAHPPPHLVAETVQYADHHPQIDEETATAAVVGEVGGTARIAAAEGHTHHPTLDLHLQHRGNAGGHHPSPKAVLLHLSLAEEAETAALPAPALVPATALFHGHPSEPRRTQPNSTPIKRADIEEDERRRSPSPVQSPRGRTRTRSISRPHSPANDDAEMTGTKDQEASADQPVPQQDPQKEAE